jgi:hypothetical protein
MRLEWLELGKMANKVARQLIWLTHAVHEPSAAADHSVTTRGTRRALTDNLKTLCRNSRIWTVLYRY